MKILLIGGSGMISSSIARIGVERGHEMTVLNRGYHKEYVPDGCTVISGDANDPEISKKLEGMHFDVITVFVAYTPAQLAAHMDAFYPHCEQYIFISSATVYSRADQKTPIREDVTPITNVDWDYAREKIGCEKYLEMRKIMDPDLCYTILRPYVTYGDTRIPFPLAPYRRWTIAKRIIEGKPILLPNTKNTGTITHADDFATAFFGLCKNEKAYGEAFHITSTDIHPWTDVAEIIGEYFGVETKFAFRSVEDIARGFYPRHPDTYGLLKADKATSWSFDNSKLLSVVPEFSPSVSLREGLYRMLDTVVAHEDFLIDEKWDELCDAIIKGRT